MNTHGCQKCSGTGLRQDRNEVMPCGIQCDGPREFLACAEHACYWCDGSGVCEANNSECSECELTDFTADGVAITPGLVVWTNDYVQAVVKAAQKYRNPSESQWWDMETLDGKRSAMMDGSRMSVRKPF